MRSENVGVVYASEKKVAMKSSWRATAMNG